MNAKDKKAARMKLTRMVRDYAKAQRAYRIAYAEYRLTETGMAEYQDAARESHLEHCACLGAMSLAIGIHLIDWPQYERLSARLRRINEAKVTRGVPVKHKEAA